ncbi:unnamed protein product [Clonostachys rhizophaga]|uniref:Uncharacterized protein n=1 Tax=Clonostachys rhizophaga TaxID=160324 RepID=A0A9N9VKZ5_9HYPO|nr:unnamed protein product [Clonostachys rhizophaga]
MERNPDRLAVLSLSSDAWSAKAMGVLMARTQTTSTCSRCALVLCFTGSEVAKVGHCDPIPGDEVECNLGLGSSTFWSKFHCYLASTVDDVNDEATS